MRDWTSIDRQMQQFSLFLRDECRIDPPLSNTIGTTIATEVGAIEPEVVHEVCPTNDVPLEARLDELVAFQAWMDIVHRGQPHLAVVRAQVIVQNYICFVYLGEAVFKAIPKHMAKSTVSAKCCRFLTDNPVRAFRNALAHANWKYKEDFSGIVFWAKKGDQKDEPMSQWEVSQHQLDFWQALARCVGYVVFTELREMEKRYD